MIGNAKWFTGLFGLLMVLFMSCAGEEKSSAKTAESVRISGSLSNDFALTDTSVQLVTQDGRVLETTQTDGQGNYGFSSNPADYDEGLLVEAQTDSGTMKVALNADVTAAKIVRAGEAPYVAHVNFITTMAWKKLNEAAGGNLNPTEFRNLALEKVRSLLGEEFDFDLFAYSADFAPPVWGQVGAGRISPAALIAKGLARSYGGRDFEKFITNIQSFEKPADFWDNPQVQISLVSQFISEGYAPDEIAQVLGPFFGESSPVREVLVTLGPVLRDLKNSLGDLDQRQVDTILEVVSYLIRDYIRDKGLVIDVAGLEQIANNLKLIAPYIMDSIAESDLALNRELSVEFARYIGSVIVDFLKSQSTIDIQAGTINVFDPSVLSLAQDLQARIGEAISIAEAGNIPEVD